MDEEPKSINGELTTLRKFNEAAFFLEELKKHYKGKEFFYYLSAYMSAARSVLWIMKSEFQRIPGWQVWYDRRETTESEDEFLKKIADIRNDLVKRSPQGLQMLMECTINKEDAAKSQDLIQKLLSGGRIVDVGEMKDPSTGVPVTIDKVFFSHENFPNEDILAVCKKYLAWLAGHLEACLAAFGIEALLLRHFDLNPRECKTRLGCESLADLCPTCLRLVLDEFKSRSTSPPRHQS